jgi:hypothetical protein
VLCVGDVARHGTGSALARERVWMCLFLYIRGATVGFIVFVFFTLSAGELGF